LSAREQTYQFGFFNERKKEKKKKRKIWDAIGTRLERIATTSDPSSSLFWSAQSHAMKNSAA
jgi:hypothetical protein